MTPILLAVLGALFTLLQAITLYYVSRIDARMDSHSSRLRVIEITCASQHGVKKS